MDMVNIGMHMHATRRTDRSVNIHTIVWLTENVGQNRRTETYLSSYNTFSKHNINQLSYFCILTES